MRTSCSTPGSARRPDILPNHVYFVLYAVIWYKYIDSAYPESLAVQNSSSGTVSGGRAISQHSSCWIWGRQDLRSTVQRPAIRSNPAFGRSDVLSFSPLIASLFDCSVAIKINIHPLFVFVSSSFCLLPVLQLLYLSFLLYYSIRHGYILASAFRGLLQTIVSLPGASASRIDPLYRTRASVPTHISANRQDLLGP
ncbi:hypothetical protein BKA64DRAFT_442900 [Cadophora sp. MPI-SDFR-AT-0126]|nr:hypothetical protein BKA64DRAFT_442900 [Leotiomycetes sp. MPI-SDFR-AT-0126]